MSARPQPIASANEATQAIENLAAIVDRLIATVEDETAHMRAGRLRAALALEETKSELAHSYATESGRLKVAEALVVRALPAALKDLRRRHERFQNSAANQSHGTGHRPCSVGRHHPRGVRRDGQETRALDLRREWPRQRAERDGGAADGGEPEFVGPPRPDGGRARTPVESQ